MSTVNTMRTPAEKLYAAELNSLITYEKHQPPEGWKLSPASVKTFILGGQTDEMEISRKYIGDPRMIELCIATLMTDRGLLLQGPPGTAKSYLSELLTAAISLNSGLLVQGTMSTTEDQIKYGFNYAILISKGPSERALIPSPVYAAMSTGKVARLEELSRCSPEIQDSLISILSEKVISVPELGTMVRAARGFSVIATANSQDLGAHEISAALARRFNCIHMPPPATFEEEVEIVKFRTASIARESGVYVYPGQEQIYKVVTILRELRTGQTMDGSIHFRRPTSACSVAEAISVLAGASALAQSFGNGVVTDEDTAAMLPGAVMRSGIQDKAALEEYQRAVLHQRGPTWEAYANLKIGTEEARPNTPRQ
jgi:MoxR-like ATPase